LTSQPGIGKNSVRIGVLPIRGDSNLNSPGKESRHRTDHPTSNGYSGGFQMLNEYQFQPTPQKSRMFTFKEAMLKTHSNPMLSIFLLIQALLVTLIPLTAAAQNYPAKPIRIVVAATPGTATDNVARIFAPEMRNIIGQPLIVDNKPGADYRIGFEYVAKQMPADGYTLVSVNVEILALLPVVSTELQFNPLTDLPPVAGLGEGKYTMVVPATTPWKTINEFVSNAKANPGKLNFGATSPIGRLSSEQFLNDAGIVLVHVPYREASRYWVDLVTNVIQTGFVAVGTAITLGQKVKVLAVTGDNRSSQFPDVPTFKELGYPRIRGLTYTINVRAGTPRPIVEKLYATISQVLKQDNVKTQLERFQINVAPETPDEAAASLASAAIAISETAKKIGMKPE
jgi:tripartite-type tricarboxylate transporter receptor subunit TctC